MYVCSIVILLRVRVRGAKTFTTLRVILLLFYFHWFYFQGLTVRLEEGRVVVARVLIDSIIDRQDLLSTGDIILQVRLVPEKMKRF